MVSVCSKFFYKIILKIILLFTFLILLSSCGKKVDRPSTNPNSDANKTNEQATNNVNANTATDEVDSATDETDNATDNATQIEQDSAVNAGSATDETDNATQIAQNSPVNANATTKEPKEDIPPYEFLHVCDRTEEVKNEILKQVEKTDCSEVTKEDLESIVELQFFTAASIKGEIPPLLPDGVVKEGDFSGLTSLKTLALGRNPISELPDKIFYGLSSIERLSCSRCQLTSLPEGLLNNLTTLIAVDFGFNQLSSLPEGLLNGLVNLQEIWLTKNQFSELSNEPFSGLESLELLFLRDNQISVIPDDFFDNLPSIKYVNLAGNQISSLPEGMFDTAVKRRMDKGKFFKVILHGNPIPPFKQGPLKRRVNQGDPEGGGKVDFENRQ